MVTVFLDTDVCIDLMRGRVSSAQMAVLRRYDGGMTVSSITWGELEVGVARCAKPEQERRKLEELFQAYPVAPFDILAARHYGEIRGWLERRGELIGPLDQLIAAHARSGGAPLITANLKEFAKVPGLKCVAWR